MSGGFEHAAPGATVAFVTNSDAVAATFEYTGLVTRAPINTIGRVYVDGVLQTPTFSKTSGSRGELYLPGLGAASKTIEIVWPYWTSVDLINVRVRRGATVSAATPPIHPIVAMGDSITQGSAASDISKVWSYMVGRAQSRQIINLGYGSRTVSSADATALSNTGATDVFYMIGYNNFAAQTALAAFQSSIETWITNARSALPSAKLWLVSPIYSTSTNTIPLADYRTAISNAVTAVADGNSAYVDGLSLMTNSADRLSDGIHPNDLGNSEIATAINALL